MIVGIGVDLVEVARIERAWARFGDRFAGKILADDEMATLAGRSDGAAWLAKRFAAKEAAAKALGTGMRRGIHFGSIVVTRTRGGKPGLSFKGEAAARAAELGVVRELLSISDEPGHAIAFVVLES